MSRKNRGQISDIIANACSTWTFIFSLIAIVIAWVIVNSTLKNPFDGYPFIFLTLLLSVLAVLQAPIILMSQRRTEEKDRARDEESFSINKKSELLIEELLTKIKKMERDHELEKDLKDNHGY